jgi:trk system potassium uptake protein
VLYRDICRTLAYYLWILLFPLSIPLLFCLYEPWIRGTDAFPYPSSTSAFTWTLVICACLAGIFSFVGRKAQGRLYRREALLLVLSVYFLTPAIGALPFLLSKTLSNPIDGYFEAVSGLTTTGSTILFPKKYNPQTNQEIPYIHTIQSEPGKTTEYLFYGTVKPVIDPQTQQTRIGLEALSRPLLFWRSLMQWLGGGGIIVLFVAILPALGVGGKILFQTEVTGPTKESLFPRIKETASQLWKIYLSLTLLEVILLMLTNRAIPLFDAITISLSTLSTGGFSPHHTSIAYYNNAWTDCVVILFMLLGSINFSIYFFCMHGRFIRLKDPELKVFLAIVLCSSLFAAWQLLNSPFFPLDPTVGGEYLNFWQALRYGAFQVISAQTSTGFATANYDLWPFSIQLWMFVLTYIGGMAASTAGGLKVIRQQTFFHIMLRKIESIYRPDIVRTYRIGTAVIDPSTAITILCMFMIATSLSLMGTFFLVIDGVDLETSFATIGCMLNNGGFGFRMGGPTESFAFLSSFGKILSCIWMVAGRLEYYALLIAFIPAFWRTSY